MTDLSLFDPVVLEHINCHELVEKHLKEKIAQTSEVSVKIRPLLSSDYDYVTLLEQLTVVGKIERRQFDGNRQLKLILSQERFLQMASCPDTYFVVVLVNEATGSIIGAATLFLELKFIHCCSKRGHIEDVVVDSKFRGMNLGKLLIDILIRIGKHMGCYKISLDCSDDKVGFYEKLGFQSKNNIMYIRFDEN
uniref:Glucosamine 6-phosphate N-acetyltransferase n=1 Tax=Trichobilharzia regenti TaxID=157069 RepID=A0AA85JI57_TRIRE|nr:unnamed protein product [Trichobilharzia regenti]